MANGKLTPKQEAFIREYLVDLNATAAYKRAGYAAANDHVAAANAHALMRKHEISSAIEAALNERNGRVEVTADRVLLELARVAFSDPRKLYRADGTLRPPSEWDDETAAAIAGVETDETVLQIADGERLTTRTHKVKRWNKVLALDKLAKHVGLYPEKGAAGQNDEPPLYGRAEGE